MNISMKSTDLHHENKHIIDFLFLLGLFVIFVLSALMLIMIGANVYQKTVNNMQINYEGRTAYAYLTEKFRQNDMNGKVVISENDNGQFVAFYETINDEEFVTYLYENEGYLMELFTRVSAEFDPHAGQKITEVSAFQISAVEVNLFRVQLQLPTDKSPVEFLVSSKTN